MSKLTIHFNTNLLPFMTINSYEGLGGEFDSLDKYKSHRNSIYKEFIERDDSKGIIQYRTMINIIKNYEIPDKKRAFAGLITKYEHKFYSPSDFSCLAYYIGIDIETENIYFILNDTDSSVYRGNRKVVEYLNSIDLKDRYSRNINLFAINTGILNFYFANSTFIPVKYLDPQFKFDRNFEIAGMRKSIRFNYIYNFMLSISKYRKDFVSFIKALEYVPKSYVYYYLDIVNYSSGESNYQFILHRDKFKNPKKFMQEES